MRCFGPNTGTIINPSDEMCKELARSFLVGPGGPLLRECCLASHPAQLLRVCIWDILLEGLPGETARPSESLPLWASYLASHSYT